EFQVLVQSGEDVIAACTQCNYAANLEVAEAGHAEPIPAQAVPAPEKIATPGKKTIEDVSSFLGAPPQAFLKSLLYVAGTEIVMAVVRGDHEVNEVKLSRALGVGEVHLATSADVERSTNAKVGFAGPVGFNGRVIVDRDAARVPDAVTGANEVDQHLQHVQFERDFTGQVAAIRSVKAGDRCPACGAPLALYRGIEAGHIFLLGTHYSSKMGASYLDEKGENRAIVMGCYGIGVSRLVATAIEQHHDTDGIVWPMSIAPYQVHLVQVGEDPEVLQAVAKLEGELEARGVEVLVDDRAERPGVKFKDADLIGIPLRVTIGAKALKSGAVEFKARSERDPKKADLLPVDGAAEKIVASVRQLLASAAPSRARTS
ncbi:MAG TPA: proline--tRNA ligase, partial [Polyangiaceae bacterium]|nr:proline--tRNA ligase [Polyangiaceae bacterium]